MALPVALSDMLTAVYQRANMPNPIVTGAATFVTQSEATSYLNKGLQEAYAEVQDSYGDDFIATTTLSGVNGATSVFPLPFAFSRLLGVDATVGGLTTSLKSFTFRERNDASQSPWANTPYGIDMKYRLQGQNIAFMPPPQPGTSLAIWYQPASPILVNLSDTFDDTYGVAEFAIWHCVGIMLAKEESDAGFALSERESARARIRSSAPQRDAGDAPRVTDVRRGSSGPFGWGGGW